ncbi:MAG TPA: hypothetical protein VJ455_10625 [Ignavibacteria bacterium]|nr:hypothetical protein [Ignavibacteria bacterium]
MKTIILFPSSFFFALSLQAQIILNTNDLPSVGDVQISVKVDSIQALTLSPGNAGANMLWDFSNLQTCCGSVQNSYDTLTWILPSGTPYAANFPLSNLAYKKDCYIEHSHITHLDEEYCNYTYCIKNNNGVLLYGYYKTDAKTYDKMRFVFPLMQYGDTLLEDARLIYYSSVDTVKVRYIQNSCIADGWGTVITPLDTSAALRVQTTEIIYDSIYVNSVGSLQSTTDSNYQYHWFTKTLGFPVMQIFKSSLHQENSYYQNASYAAFKTVILSTPELYQNNTIQVINTLSGKEVIFIFPDDILVRDYSIELFDVTGRKIIPQLTLFSNKITVSFNNYSGGIYLYRIGNTSQTLQTGIVAVE